MLVHGFKFHPDVPDADPHRSLFALRPAGDGRRIRSWPEGLGFARRRRRERASASASPGRPARRCSASLVTTGRTGFARVYDRAAGYGARLAELVALLQRLAPGRPVDLLAHSLGARVALAALPALAEAPGRVILLGAAEFDARARDFVRACRAPARRRSTTSPPAPTTSTTSPSRPSPRAAAGASGRWGCGLGAQLPHWLDLQLDRAEVTAWINGLGIPLTAASARLCHWGFYTRGGALAVYQAILRRRPGWDIASLRAAPCFAAQEPRWSRLLPRRPAPPRPPLGIGGESHPRLILPPARAM